jgi:predicted Na+-dependent transporter
MAMEMELSQAMLPLHRMLDENTAVEAAGSVSNTDTGSADSSDVFQTLIEIGTNVLLFLLIFGMAATVDFRNLKRQLKNRYAIATGIGMQFVIMPFLGFLAVITLKGQGGITTSMGITLLIVTSSPGGSYSNWWCSMFNADLALSVTMTAISTILSIGLLPANLMLYAHAAYGFDGDDEKNVLKSVDFVALMVSLIIVISAICTGLYASYKLQSLRFRKIANAMGSLSGILLVVVSAVFSSVGSDEDSGTDGDSERFNPWKQDWTVYVGVALPCVGGLALANILSKCAKLENPEVVTLSVECCYQNVGIATSAVLAMFDDKDEIAAAMFVPLFYGLVEMGVLGIYCVLAWKIGWTKAPKEENMCIILTKTYEISEDEEKEEAEYDNADMESQRQKSSSDMRQDDVTITMVPSMSSDGNSSSNTPVARSGQVRNRVLDNVRGNSRSARNRTLTEVSEDDLSFDHATRDNDLSLSKSGFSFEDSLRNVNNALNNCNPFRKNPKHNPRVSNGELGSLQSNGSFRPTDITCSQTGDGDASIRKRADSDLSE